MPAVMSKKFGVDFSLASNVLGCAKVVGQAFANSLQPHQRILFFKHHKTLSC